MEDWDIVAGTRASSRTEPKKGRDGSLVVRKQEALRSRGAKEESGTPMRGQLRTASQHSATAHPGRAKRIEACAKSTKHESGSLARAAGWHVTVQCVK
jgi:hypothetical protein